MSPQDWITTTLLVVLTIINIGRWTQTRESQEGAVSVSVKAARV